MSGIRTWKSQMVVEFRNASPVDFLKTMLFEDTLRDNKALYSEYVRGYADTDKVREFVKTYKGATLLYRSVDPDADNIELYGIEMSGFTQLVELSYSDQHIDIIMYSDSEIEVQIFVRSIRDQLSEAPVRGTVYMLASEQQFYLSPLGEVHSPLERGNYPEDNLAQFDRVLEDLASDIPSGRLTLLNGDPGTGKSFLVRGLISAVKGLFIYIPAAVSGRITGPDIVPVIMREKDKDVPIILIMEDADSALATRQLDNVSRLSDLLNMSDGLLGDMADLRIIATTNSRRDDIDKAVVRDGRMNEYIQLEPLKISHAQDVLNRLLGGTFKPGSFLDAPRGQVPLSQVYSIARKFGWKPPMKEKKNRRNYPIARDYDY